MSLPDTLRDLRFTASTFVHHRASAAQTAAEIAAVVAALNGSVLMDDGKAIAAAAAALLVAGCAGIREFYLRELTGEIRTALRALGEYL